MTPLAYPHIEGGRVGKTHVPLQAEPLRTSLTQYCALSQTFADKLYGIGKRAAPPCLREREGPVLSNAEEGKAPLHTNPPPRRHPPLDPTPPSAMCYEREHMFS